MSQVRCPLCSHLNPPEAEICSFCGARLKPLKPSPGNQPDAPKGENQPEDANDWLHSLQSDESEPVETPAGQPESEEVMPDWLSRIRSRAQTEVGGEEDQSSDWMQGLSEEDEPSEQASSDDWLNRLENPSAVQSEQPAEAQPAADLPDWLKDLSGQPGAQIYGTDQPSEPSQDLEEEDFSWLGGEEQPEKPAEASPGFGLTGFLSAIENSSTEITAPEGDETPSTEDVAETKLPDWLQSEQPQSADASTTGADLPDWLGGLDIAPEETPQSEAETDASIPGWMSELGELPAGLEEPGAVEAELSGTSDAEGLPAWMLDNQDSGVGAQEPASIDDTTFAISGTTQDEDTLGEGTIGEGLPDWMTEFETPASEQPEPPDMPASTPLFSDDLTGFPQPESSAFEPALDAPQETLSSDLPDESVAPTADVPDWLQGFGEQETTGAAVPALFGTEGSPLAAGPTEEEQPFAVDLPDWLSEDAPREPGQESPLVAEPAEEELAQVDLPDWVKEMRPIESIIPGESQVAEVERRAEKSGPLAGLAGILPAEDLTSRYRRPPVYSAKLRVTEKQRGQASQFESLIAQESQPLLIPTRGKSAQGTWLRLLIALLMIFVLALPPLLGLEPLAIPTLSPDETRNMYEQIEGGLSADSPVLLAVDFDPALWGEMKLASQPVIDHLMARGVRIIVVSTRATGPALAEQLLSQTVANHTGYNLGEKTENLGFLPGDMISLLEFAQQPAFAAPANLAGELTWGQSSMQGITNMRDFSTVVVLTDTAETGRAWVEQVQPEMANVPLLMVTSAQAAPMMAPFVESGQVDGMVSGLLGGVLYSQWTRQEGLGMSYLASYQIGVLLALALALGGGLISGAIAMLNRGKDED